MPANFEARDKKLRKRRELDMRVSGRSIFIIEQSEAKRGARIIAKANDRARKMKERGYEDGLL